MFSSDLMIHVQVVLILDYRARKSRMGKRGSRFNGGLSNPGHLLRLLEDGAVSGVGKAEQLPIAVSAQMSSLGTRYPAWIPVPGEGVISVSPSRGEP